MPCDTFYNTAGPVGLCLRYKRREAQPYRASFDRAGSAVCQRGAVEPAARGYTAFSEHTAEGFAVHSAVLNRQDSGLIICLGCKYP